MFRFRISFLVAITCLALTSTASAQVDFERDIKPIFEVHCLQCHGEEEEKAFRIDDMDATLDGYVEAGDSEASHLYEVLIAEDDSEIMPPPDTTPPLSEAQIQLVKTWIDEGAEWPEELESEWKLPEPPKVDDSQLPYRAAGSLHPALVHMPIGLLMAAGLFAFLSLRGNFVMSDCAYYCLWLGAIGAVFACVSGWYYTDMKAAYPEVKEIADILDQEDPNFWHRISGLGATAFAVILALFAASSRNKDPDDGLLWKLAVILLACAIGFVGKTGGELTHGRNHYKDLKALYSSFFDESGKEDGDRTVDEDELDDSETPDAESMDDDVEPLST